MQHFEVVSMGIVYRRVANDEIEFLLMRRVPSDGGFWQPVTGAIEAGEAPREAAIREVAEEVGITEALHISEEIHRQAWGDADFRGEDVVHAFEVASHVEVTLNDAEHDAYEWLRLEAALERLKYDSNKLSLRQAHTYALGRGAQG